MATTIYTIQERRGTASQWMMYNPVLLDGQWGIELDTGKAKLGDGTSAWSSLPYFLPSDQINLSGLSYVLLEANETVADVPVDTPDGIPIFRKYVEPEIPVEPEMRSWELAPTAQYRGEFPDGYAVMEDVLDPDPFDSVSDDSDSTYSSIGSYWDSSFVGSKFATLTMTFKLPSDALDLENAVYHWRFRAKSSNGGEVITALETVDPPPQYATINLMTMTADPTGPSDDTVIDSGSSITTGGETPADILALLHGEVDTPTWFTHAYNGYFVDTEDPIGSDSWLDLSSTGTSDGIATLTALKSADGLQLKMYNDMGGGSGNPPELDAAWHAVFDIYEVRMVIQEFEPEV